MKVAIWRAGARYKADPQKCADEIMQICDDLESATPRDILEKARGEDTELHKCFTWNDSVAAERYRLIEAKKLVGLLVVKNDNDDDESKEKAPPVRFFYKTVDDEGYKPTELIVRQQDEYEALLARAWNELRQFKRKYEMLSSELAEIFALID